MILGTEGDGLAADVIQSADYTARIPMAHGVDSLNVAAASALAFGSCVAADSSATTYCGDKAGTRSMW